MSRLRNIPGRTIATAVTVTLAVLVVVMAAGLGYVLVQNADQNRDLEQVVQSIQVERVRNIRENCEAQNARNRLTTLRLREMTDDPGARALAGGLIQALVPVRDCDRLVERQTGTSTP